MRFIIIDKKSEASNFLEEKVNIANLENYTKIYIVNLLSRYISSNNDLSKSSLTLLYSKAIENNNFSLFQKIGDWLMFSKSLFPQSLNAASNEYYETLARNAYYKCFIILQKKWLIYEELADKFSHITAEINNSFYSSNDGLLR